MAENFERPDKIEIKQFTTNCLNMSGGTSPVTLYLGHPMRGSHPLAFQNKSLSTRGYSIPEHVMESFKKLADIAEKNNVPFIELCDYVIKEVELGKSLKEDSKKATEISSNTEEKDMQSTQLIEDSETSSSENNSENEQPQANAGEESALNYQAADQSKENLSLESSQPVHTENQQNDQSAVINNSLVAENDLQSTKNKTADEGKSLFSKISKKNENPGLNDDMAKEEKKDN